VVLAALAERSPEEPFAREAASARVRASVRHFLNQRFHRKPMVLPMILEV
jgi:mRNA degradation ribonuclease J1/J2